MLGLPGDSTTRFIDSMHQVAELNPDFVRLYPAVVLEGSGLAEMTRAGRYQPMSLNRAVAMAARAKAFFAGHAIPVVRMGLQPSPELADKAIAGPYHPAFGELVLSRLFFKTARRLLAQYGPGRLTVAPEDESALRGQKNCTIRRLQNLGLLAVGDRKIKTVPGRARYTVQLVDTSPITSIFKRGATA